MERKNPPKASKKVTKVMGYGSGKDQYGRTYKKTDPRDKRDQREHGYPEDSDYQVRKGRAKKRIWVANPNYKPGDNKGYFKEVWVDDPVGESLRKPKGKPKSASEKQKAKTKHV